MGPPETVDHFRVKPKSGISAPSENNPENDPYKKFPADYRGKPTLRLAQHKLPLKTKIIARETAKTSEGGEA